MVAVLNYIGRFSGGSLTTIGGVTRFSGRATLEVGRLMVSGNRSSYRVLLNQIWFTGMQALPFILFFSTLLGSIVITQAHPWLQGVGAESMVGELLNVVVIRELGPLLLALILVNRSGTAIAGELATMRMSREIEALEAMGIDPVEYLIAPRIVAMVVAGICLTVYFNAMALLGGFVVASFTLHMSFEIFWQVMGEAVTFQDSMLSIFKSGMFAIIIAMLSCYNGLLVGRSTTDVPVIVSKTTVQSIFSVFLASGILTFLVYT
jgi:phospholipid/cholesterol/gamma-HCH transport system permease protein